jgi:hypothetical protein
MSFKLIYLNLGTGEQGLLPDYGIVNIGGTIGPTFTVQGKPLLFADGTSTDGSSASLLISLQGAYASSNPATINLTAGKDLVFNAVNNKAFQFNASTGKVTITGDLEVLGSSAVIEGVISNVDQVSIGAPNGTTSSLLIEPMVGVTMGTDLVRIRSVNGGPQAFTIDNLGNTFIRTLSVNGIDFTTFYNAFSSHINPLGIKHGANQISVTPLVNLPGTDVQTVLEAIDTFIATGAGAVSSVGISSTDLTVTGSPITSFGTIALALNTVPISKGGTGQTTQVAAINALLPAQAGFAGRVLSTDGSTASWVAPAATSSSSAGLFFTDVAPTATGIVGAKGYVPGTVPANRVVLDATTDTNNVTVTLFAEGDSAFYSPTVTITTSPPQAGGPVIATMVEDATDKRSYIASANLIISTDTIVTGISSANATATTMIHRAAVGPALNTLAITTLPLTQTEVKAGDVVGVNGSVANSAVYVELLAAGASSAVTVLAVGADNSAGVGFKTITGSFIVGSGIGASPVQARARSSLGTYGVTFTSTNTVMLNQTYPTIGTRTISYPATQLAVKGAESATVTATITNFDTVSYTATNLTVAAPSTYSAAKVVTRASGVYIVGLNNYTISATKASNNATSTAQAAVSIADAVPSAAISIAGSPARLISSPTGTDYVVTITASQQLITAPTLVASSGTWQGSWTGAGTTWSRTLRIVDTDPKGLQIFSSITLQGLSNIIGSTISAGGTYTVGGFSSRVITFAAFERFHTIGTQVTDFTKVTASYTGSSTLTRRTDTLDAFQSFTITTSDGAYSGTGSYLFISDLAFSGANTSGTLQLTVQEAA